MTTGGSREMTVTKADGSTRTQRWDFPSRSDCRTCHSTSSDNVLGVRSHQLARESYYDLTGRTSNQLETWNALGIFGTSFGSRNPATLPHSVDPHDPHASLDHRVKSYLDANCSHCHRFGGGGGQGMDARSQLSRQRVRSAWMFLVPMLVVLAAVAGWPLLRTIY